MKLSEEVNSSTSGIGSPFRDQEWITGYAGTAIDVIKEEWRRGNSKTQAGRQQRKGKGWESEDR